MTFLRQKSTHTASEAKDEIQGLLRQIVIERDGGCVLRHYREAGACGGYTKAGDLILQFDHLNSRVHSSSFGDERLGVCVCKRHHIFWKKQYPAKYEELVRRHIGKARCDLLDRVREDNHKPYKADWKLVKLGLERTLKNLKKI